MPEEIVVYHRKDYERGTGNELLVSLRWGYGVRKGKSIRHISYRVSLEALAEDIASQIITASKAYKPLSVTPDVGQRQLSALPHGEKCTLDTKVKLSDEEWGSFISMVANRLIKQGYL